MTRNSVPIKWRCSYERADHIHRAGLVDYPEQVELSEIKGGNTMVFELSVARKDLGKVIGKRGRNINAIRTILTAAAAQKGRAILQIVE